jgi:hypothetical protein
MTVTSRKLWWADNKAEKQQIRNAYINFVRKRFETYRSFNRGMQMDTHTIPSSRGLTMVIVPIFCFLLPEGQIIKVANITGTDVIRRSSERCRQKGTHLLQMETHAETSVKVTQYSKELPRVLTIAGSQRDLGSKREAVCLAQPANPVNCIHTVVPWVFAHTKH